MSNIRWFTDGSQLDPEAVLQIRRTARMPFVHGIAVMADAHLGKGSTVGTVVVTDGAVMPACVGVDIGCGMMAIRTTLSPTSVRQEAQKIRESIEKAIPLGKAGNNDRLPSSVKLRISELERKAAATRGGLAFLQWIDQHNWHYQIGSLGGGNHFIEVCESDDNKIWVILHSGSRGIGNKIATEHTKKAKKLAQKYMYESWLPDPDLAYLPRNDEHFDYYMSDLQWAQDYALVNREELMDRTIYAILTALNLDFDPITTAVGIEEERINCHHNFTKLEHHDGKNLYVTRKGAIEARTGMKALIPGAMGKHSYIVEGCGFEASFYSAPHGAGRKMSRRMTRVTYTVDDLIGLSDALEFNPREDIVDEHPGAYKDLDVVMQESEKLIKPLHRLTPIINVKGD